MLQKIAVPRPVVGRVTHHWQHLDEVRAMWLAINFGEKLLPGIKTAPLIKWDAGQPPPDGRTIAEWEQDHVVFGTGRGEGDEHGLSRSERQTTRATSLAVQLLGLQERPEYAHLREVNDLIVDQDAKGHRTTWDAFSICWALYFHGLSEEQVETFFFGWFSAIYFANANNVTPRTAALPAGQPSLNDYLREWVVEEYSYRGTAEDIAKARRAETAKSAAEALNVADWREVSHVLKLENRLHTFGAATIMDIHSYVEWMALAGTPESTTRSWVYLVLAAKRQEQRLFLAASDEVAASAEQSAVRFVFLFRDEANRDRLVRVNSDAKGREAVIESWCVKRRHRLIHEIAIVESANYTAHKAVRNLYKTPVTVPADPAVSGSKPRSWEQAPDIIVLRKPTRHINVFLQNGDNNRKNAGVPIVRRIRTAEYEKGPNAKKSVDRSVFTGEYNIPEVPEWCWFPEGNQLHNGTLTAPNTPATRLSLDTVVDVIIEGLRYLFSEPWKHKGRPQRTATATTPANGDTAKSVSTGKRNDRRPRKGGGRPATVSGSTAALSSLGDALKNAGVVAESEDIKTD